MLFVVRMTSSDTTRSRSHDELGYWGVDCRHHADRQIERSRLIDTIAIII